MHNNITTVIGFDFGKKVIGVAVGQTITQSASPKDVIVQQPSGVHWQQIKKLITTWSADALVVGIPKGLSANNHIEAAALEFAHELKQRYGLDVYTVDENYTSTSAKSQVKDQGLKAPKRLDSIAAQIILESWLKNPPRPPL